MKAGTNMSLLLLGAAWLHGQTPSHACTTPLRNEKLSDNYLAFFFCFFLHVYVTRERIAEYMEFIYKLSIAAKAILRITNLSIVCTYIFEKQMHSNRVLMLRKKFNLILDTFMSTQTIDHE